MAMTTSRTPARPTTDRIGRSSQLAARRPFPTTLSVGSGLRRAREGLRRPGQGERRGPRHCTRQERAGTDLGVRPAEVFPLHQNLAVGGMRLAGWPPCSGSRHARGCRSRGHLRGGLDGTGLRRRCSPCLGDPRLARRCLLRRHRACRPRGLSRRGLAPICYVRGLELHILPAPGAATFLRAAVVFAPAVPIGGAAGVKVRGTRSVLGGSLGSLPDGLRRERSPIVRPPLLAILRPGSCPGSRLLLTPLVSTALAISPPSTVPPVSTAASTGLAAAPVAPGFVLVIVRRAVVLRRTGEPAGAARLGTS